MNSDVYKNLLSIIETDYESLQMLVEADNVLGLNVSIDDITSYLEFFNKDKALVNPIVGNTIITEGDILSILKIINDLVYYEGEYTLYINDDNIGTITYLVKCANYIYNTLGKNIHINIDYSDNYNKYVNELVTVIGSNEFVLASSKDFNNSNQIIV